MDIIINIATVAFIVFCSYKHTILVHRLNRIEANRNTNNYISKGQKKAITAELDRLVYMPWDLAEKLNTTEAMITKLENIDNETMSRPTAGKYIKLLRNIK